MPVAFGLDSLMAFSRHWISVKLRN